MADPLSIAASVTGLIAVAGQIATLISKFVANAADAPSSARAALSAIEEMRLALISVKQVMDRLQMLPKHRKQMIHVKHLVIVFRESVLSVSQLEQILRPAYGMLDRFKWLREEEGILRCLAQLESHKSSFSFILNVLQSESELEAQESLNSLQTMVQQLLEQNQEILIRLEQYESNESAASVRFFDDASTIRPTRGAPAALEPEVITAITSREFDAALEASRVYRRVQSYDTDMSFTSSKVRSHAWSMLSGLSLSDISTVSVIALPLTLDEINKIGGRLTSADMFQDNAVIPGPRIRVQLLDRSKPARSPLLDRSESARSGRPRLRIPSLWSPKASKEPDLPALIAQDEQRLSREVKMIILGAHETGRTTFLKQLRLMADRGFSDNERDMYRVIIFENIVNSILYAEADMETLEISFEDMENNRNARYIRTHPLYVNGLNRGDHFPQDLLTPLKALWKDKGIQLAIGRGNEYCLPNDAYRLRFYFGRFDRLFHTDYTPSDEDILYSYVKTTGISEVEFTMGALNYRWFDAGGTRAERKKWIHVFEDVHAVVFFAALSEYDEVLLEDCDGNRMQESLMLFESICNSRWFDRTNMILCLNKTDILKEKLPRSPINKYFPEYEGGEDFDAACKFFSDKFTRLNKWENKKVYVHFTCAVDVAHTRSVIAEIHDLIMDQNVSYASSV